jgi:hypothetical protein
LNDGGNVAFDGRVKEVHVRVDFVTARMKVTTCTSCPRKDILQNRRNEIGDFGIIQFQLATWRLCSVRCPVRLHVARCDEFWMRIGYGICVARHIDFDVYLYSAFRCELENIFEVCGCVPESLSVRTLSRQFGKRGDLQRPDLVYSGE